MDIILLYIKVGSYLDDILEVVISTQGKKLGYFGMYPTKES